MPSFSKVVSFLMVFAVTSSITIITIDAACEWIGLQAGTSKIFADHGHPSDYDAYCQAWEGGVLNL